MTGRNKRHIHIGSEGPERGLNRFVEAWERAEQGNDVAAEVHLNFEDLRMLLAVLTSRRLEILRTLRKHPLSIRALSRQLERNYKNVHADVRALEAVDLLERTEEGEFYAPWDVIDAHVDLVA